MEIKDLEKGDIVWFQGITGFSLDIASKRFTAFSSPARGLAQSPKWDHVSFNLSDIRSFQKQVGLTTEFSSSGSRGGVSGGVRQMGEGVGFAVRNALEKSKAKKQNGLLFELKSTQMPYFFVQVTDPLKQNQLFEAIRQTFEGGRVDNKIVHIPDSVRNYFRVPSKEQLEKFAALNEQKAQSFHRAMKVISSLVVGTIILATVFYLATSRAYKNALLNGENMLEAGAFRCVMLKFGYSSLPRGAHSIVVQTFTAETKDKKSKFYPSYIFERGSYTRGPLEGNRTFYAGPKNGGVIEIDSEKVANFVRAVEPSCD